MLAVEREPASIGQSLAEAGQRFGRWAVVEAVEALCRRALVERAETPGAAAFTLQSAVLEYVTDRPVEDVAEKIGRAHPALLVEQPLIQARAKEYPRHTQEPLIGTPILERLKARQGEDGTARRLLDLLDGWRRWSPADQGYGATTAINLLRLLRSDPRGLGLFRLALRRVYLAQLDAQDARLVDAHLAESVLAEALDFPSSGALNGDGALRVAGTSTGRSACGARRAAREGRCGSGRQARGAYE